MTRTRTIISLFLLLAIPTGIFMISRSETKDASAADKKVVTTQSATTSSFQPEVDFSGFVSGTKSADLAPRGSGFVVRMLKEEGDRVSQGETLAVLEAAEVGASRQGALDTLHALDTAVSRTERYYEQKVDEAETALDHAEADYRNGSASAHDVETAEEALRSVKRLRDAEIASAKADRTSAAGNALLSAALSDNLIIRAPFSGVITRKYLSIGSIASPESPVYSIASADTTEILVSVPSTIARSLSTGTPVRIITDTDESELSGRIFSLAPGGDAMTQQSLARIRVDTSADRAVLRLGEHARVRFPAGAAYLALMIPETAIEHVYDNARVSVVENGTIRHKTVTLGQSRGAEREILSGLEPGEHIVIEGMRAIRSEQSVTEHYVEY